MKTQKTIRAYEKHGSSGIVRYLNGVVKDMPEEIQEIFEGSRGVHCVGEIALYDLLTKDQIPPVIAAQAAVCFPDPFKFHRLIGAGISVETKEAYLNERAKGTPPLDSLVIAAEVSSPYSVSTREYEIRKQRFREFVRARYAQNSPQQI